MEKGDPKKKEPLGEFGSLDTTVRLGVTKDFPTRTPQRVWVFVRTEGKKEQM